MATVSVAEGDVVWIKDTKRVWSAATVTSVARNEGKAYVTNNEDGESEIVPIIELVEAMPNDVQGVDDLLQLDNMHEASILHTLRKRHKRSQCYTWIGPIMIFVNPYSDEGQSTDQEILDNTLHAGFQPIGGANPHIYPLASAVYRDLVETGRSQSVLITGESGAGKTTMARMLLRYMTLASEERGAADSSLDSDADASLEERIVSAGPVMEAFGNAQTVRNKNSSRFGKYLKVYFSASGKTQGAKITIYLLEKSRVVNQDKGERNFHVLYQYLAAASHEERREFRLRQPKDFSMLNKSGVYSINGVDDKEEYMRVLESFSRLGIEIHEVKSIHKVLAALLHLGNIKFTTDGVSDGAEVSEDDNFDAGLLADPNNIDFLNGPKAEGFIMAAKLLKTPPSSLEQALTVRQIRAAQRVASTYSVPLSAAQAAENRDSLIKALYELLFQWLVNRINLVIELERTDQGTMDRFPFIGILDIFGFEIFETNRFDQLCINYCNERLQQYFNKHIFQIEQQECMTEGVQLSLIQYTDNSACVKLIDDDKTGILAHLQEESLLPKGTDQILLQKLQESFAKHPNWKKVDPRKAQHEFNIIHYAGDVSYDIHGFIERNKNAISPDLVELMESSDEPFVSDLFITYRAQQMASRFNNGRSGSVSSVNDEDITSTTGGPGSPISPSTPNSTNNTGTPTQLRKLSRIAQLASSEPLPIGQHQKRSSFLKTAQTNSISVQFREQLNSLMSTINKTDAHFVRCICPNYAQEAKLIDSSVVLNQLKCTGIIDCVRIRMLGYPIRRPYKDFRARYASLLKKQWTSDPLEDTRVFLEKLNYPSKTALYQFGKTKIFLNDKINRVLELKRAEMLNNIVVPIQRTFRVHLDMKRFKEQRAAARVLQTAILSKRAAQAVAEHRGAALLLQQAIRMKIAAVVLAQLIKSAEDQRRKEEEMRLIALKQAEERRLAEETRKREKEEEEQKRQEADRKHAEEKRWKEEEERREAERRRLEEKRLKEEEKAEEQRQRQKEEEKRKEEELERQREELRRKTEEKRRLENRRKSQEQLATKTNGATTASDRENIELQPIGPSNNINKSQSHMNFTDAVRKSLFFLDSAKGTEDENVEHQPLRDEMTVCAA